MSLSEASQKAIDDYIASLRRQLRDLMEEDMNDIVEEIRAHILDKTSAGADPGQVEQTLAALGPPAALAARYRTEEMMRRAVTHRSRAQKARIALRTAGVTLATARRRRCFRRRLFCRRVADRHWHRQSDVAARHRG